MLDREFAAGRMTATTLRRIAATTLRRIDAIAKKPAASLLSAIRFLVDGRTLDLLMGTLVFGLLPVLGGDSLPSWAVWALVGTLRLLPSSQISIFC